MVESGRRACSQVVAKTRCEECATRVIRALHRMLPIEPIVQINQPSRV